MQKLAAFFVACLLSAAIFSCKDDFLHQPPHGVLSEYTLRTEEGAQALLIAAYSCLDGFTGWHNGSPWSSAASNWIYGNMLAGDAYKGSDAGDAILLLQRFDPKPDEPILWDKWRTVYTGVFRSNLALQILAETPATEIGEPERTRIHAEARFLRGHFHFEAKKMWKNVPYLDENHLDGFAPNDRDIWQDIEQDFRFALENLPETQAEVGRANKWAAAAYLAKALVFQQKFSEAKPLLDEIIANGVTAGGTKYGLNDCFHDNFNAATKNSKESVFAVQFSVNDGSLEGENGNYGELLNYPYGATAPVGCCGFHQPSQNLVNAFKTDVAGLPLLDDFNEVDVTHDEGIPSDSAFIEYAGTLDPRLDWTVGRRGIPYLDWGEHRGMDWIRDQAFGGPYSPIKNVYYKSQQGTLSTATGWSPAPNANNYTLIRFADVLLWAAECEAELGNLAQALVYVNQVRARAKNSCQVSNADGSPAANYYTELYPSFPNLEFARKAIRYERRLELALEGHRFFDLVRWGVAEVEINDYLEKEATKRIILDGVALDAHEIYFPIPQSAIDASAKNGEPMLLQNPGY